MMQIENNYGNNTIIKTIISMKTLIKVAIKIQTISNEKNINYKTDVVSAIK